MYNVQTHLFIDLAFEFHINVIRKSKFNLVRTGVKGYEKCKNDQFCDTH